MKAIVYHEYGSPDVLRCEDVEKPSPGDDEVLIKVRAAAANPMDCHLMSGVFIMRPMTGLYIGASDLLKKPFRDCRKSA